MLSETGLYHVTEQQIQVPKAEFRGSKNGMDIYWLLSIRKQHRR